MAINPTNSRDGVRRTTVRVEHRLTREEYVNALAGAIVGIGVDDDSRAIPQYRAERLVRQHLREAGGDWWAWDEQVDGDEVARALDLARTSVDGFWA